MGKFGSESMRIISKFWVGELSQMIYQNLPSAKLVFLLHGIVTQWIIIFSVGCGSDFWLKTLDDSEIRHQVPQSVCVHKHVDML